MAPKDNLITSTIVVLVLLLFSGISYSCSNTVALNDNSAEKSGKKTLIFDRDEDGKSVQYKAEFKDGEMISLERDGQKIKKEDFDKYSDIIEEETDDISGNNENFTWNSPHGRRHFSFYSSDFDTQKFTEKMNRLSDKLSKLKDIDIHINKDWDLDDMEDIDINIDADKITSEMEKATKELKKSMEELKKIDMPALKKELLKAKESLRKAGKNLKESGIQLEKLNGFMKELKEEMVKDGLIKSTSEEFSFRFKDGDIYINDNKIDNRLADKYKKIYREHFGKDMNRHFRIEIM